MWLYLALGLFWIAIAKPFAQIFELQPKLWWPDNPGASYAAGVALWPMSVGLFAYRIVSGTSA